MITRRIVCAGMGASFAGAFAGEAHAAAARSELPNGGAVILPDGYRPFAPGEAYFPAQVQSLIGYRNWRYAWSGYPESDGMIAVQRVDGEGWSLEDYVQDAKAALTVNWDSADELPRTRFTPETILFPVLSSEGPFGPEIAQQLSVPTVGMFDVYERRAHMYAVLHKAGVRVAVWILDGQGGVARARKLADQVARTLIEPPAD